MSIIISENGKNAKKIDKTEIEKEGYLQNYIHQNPESIPVYEIKEDKKLFVVAREFSTESGRIDALAIDKDGDIYVVETKLHKSTDKREVVAQALDYGASLWRHSDYNEFIANINNEINKKFSVSFEEKTKEFFDIDDEQIVSMLEVIKRNLQQGNIKFVILMDAVEDKLKDLIVYINQNSQFDIYAVQMEYYKFEKYEIMIPKLFGVEVKKSIAQYSGQRKEWDKKLFLEDAKQNLKGKQFDAVEKLVDFFSNNADNINWGTGGGQGSINPRFNAFNEKRKVIGLTSNGKIGFHFGWAKKDATNEQVECLNLFKEQLNKLGLKISEEKYDHGIYFEIEKWITKCDEIIIILKEILQK